MNSVSRLSAFLTRQSALVLAPLYALGSRQGCQDLVVTEDRGKALRLRRLNQGDGAGG